MLAFAMVALLVATFSIYNTFSIVVAQRTRESALLRALGASRRQVLRSVVFEAFLIGAIASGLGLAAGYGLAVGMKALLAAENLDLPVALVLTTGTVAAALAVGIGVTLVASIAPAVKASRVAPLAAMRDVAVDRSATSKARALAGLVTTGGGVALLIAGATGATFALVGLGTLVALIGFVLLGPVAARPAAAVLGAPVAIAPGRAGSLARRNAMRNPKRTAATASALMIGVAVVAAFTVLAASVKASVAHTADTAVKADLVLAQNDGGVPGIDPAVAPALREVPQLDKVVAAGVGTMRIGGSTEQPMVMDTTNLTDLVDMQVREGSLDHLPADGLALQADFAKSHGWTVGSEVPVTFPDGTQSTMTVDVVYGLKNLFGDILVSQDAYAPHATQPADVVILMTKAAGVTTAEAQAAAQAVAERFSSPDVQTRTAYMDSVNAQVDQALAFVYGLLAIAVTIAVMGIGNTISLSVHERTRELGLLRAIGQSRRRIRTMVRGEAIVVAVFGTVGGLLLGTLGGWAVVKAVGDDQGIGSFDLPVTRLAVVVGLGALAGVLAARRPAKRAAKLDVLGAIATR
ncbi:MAG: ABC transporter permease [Ilumatobacteraceae bacterium]